MKNTPPKNRKEHKKMNQISRDEIRSFMEKYHVDYSIADVTPTICALFGLTPPDVCGGQEIAEVIDQAGHIFGEDDRCFYFSGL